MQESHRVYCWLDFARRIFISSEGWKLTFFYDSCDMCTEGGHKVRIGRNDEMCFFFRRSERRSDRSRETGRFELTSCCSSNIMARSKMCLSRNNSDRWRQEPEGTAEARLWTMSANALQCNNRVCERERSIQSHSYPLALFHLFEFSSLSPLLPLSLYVEIVFDMRAQPQNIQSKVIKTFQ